MHRLFYAPPSPYSAKVRMAAAYAEIPIEAVIVDTNKPSDEFLTANPLGKVPSFVTEDGTAIFDSRAITQYLNRAAGGRLLPRNADMRTEAEVLEALADGICDCLLAHVYERRSRPAEIVHQPWLEKQWSKVERGLDHLNTSPPKLRTRATLGDIALRATLGYLELRFAGQWQKSRGALTRWAKRFDQRFPELTAYLPS